MLAMLACVGRLIAAEPSYLYGIHDHEPRPDEYLGHIRNYVPGGWVTATVAVGHDPNDNSGVDFTWYQNQNCTVICRLNNGYFPNGTIPLKEYYDDFAKRCANFVRNSPGCNIWIIGNELNIAGEWPARDKHLAYVEPIDYAACYRKCYDAIKAVNPNNKILSAPCAPFSGPFNAGTLPGGYTYDGCVLGWVDYQFHILYQIKATGPCDGIALHVYSRGYTYDAIHSTAKGWSNGRQMYMSFYVYKDWIDYGIPPEMYSLPVYITECDGYYFWKGGHPENTQAHYEPGWMQEVYKEIDTYNRTVAAVQNKPVIRCVNMYRWGCCYDGWNIDGDNPYKGQILSDLDAALAMGYSWPGSSTVPTGWTDDFNDTWIDDNAPEPDWVRDNQSGADSQESGGWLRLTGTAGSPSVAIVRNSEYKVYKNFAINTKISFADTTSTTSGGSAEVRFRAGVSGAGYSLVFRPSGISLVRSDTGDTIQGKTVNYTIVNGATLFVKIKCIDTSLDIKVGTTDGGSDVANWTLTDSTFTDKGCFWLANNGLTDVRFDYFTYEQQYPAVVGQIKDSFGKPIAGVTVSLSTGGYSGTTDTDGTYTITGILPGTYTITAAKTGYGSKTAVSQSIQTGTYTYNFTLTDNSKPTTPVITDAGAYQTSANSITFSWTASDPESGIVDYRTAISSTNQLTGIIAGGGWQSVGLATSHTRTGLNLMNGSTYFCFVKAINGVNLVSQGISDGVRIAKGCAYVGQAKAQPSPTFISLEDRIVTASFPDCIYIEDPDRSGGIKVLTTGIAEGTEVDLAGTMQTANGERQISPFVVTPGTAGHDLRPYLTQNHFLYGEALNAYTPGVTQGFGLHNIGGLFTTTGKVMEIGTGYFVLRDGAPKNQTLKVLLPTGVSAPAPNTWVLVTGINTVEPVTLLPALRTRKAADIAPMR